jgi:hypothetical protein
LRFAVEVGKKDVASHLRTFVVEVCMAVARRLASRFAVVRRSEVRTAAAASLSAAPSWVVEGASTVVAVVVVDILVALVVVAYLDVRPVIINRNINYFISI